MTTNTEHVSEPARKAAVSSELAPLYAVAGLTEAVTERLRSVAAESRQLVADRIAELRALRTDRAEQVDRTVGELRSRSLSDLFRTVPEFTRQQLDARLSKAGATYAELASRGKVSVDGAIGGAAGTIDPVLERLQEGVARLRKSVSDRSADKAPTDQSES